jgi:hypothetical protein
MTKTIQFLKGGLLQAALRVAVVVAGLAAPALQAGPLLSVGSAAVQVGEHFDIAISISGVDPATGLGAWQFDLAFAPALVRVDNVTEGGFLSAHGATLFGGGAIDNAHGLISLVTDAFVDLPPLPSGEGVLAVVSFTALGPGTGALTLDQAFLNFADAVNTPLDGQITVGTTTLPEPGTAGLVLLALLLAWPQPGGWPGRQRACRAIHSFKEPSP